MPSAPFASMTQRLRAALAAEAYRAGKVRLAQPDLAGCQHIVATRHGLFAVDKDAHHLIAHGFFYGITIRGNTIYAFEACDRPRHKTMLGRIICLHHNGDAIIRTEVFADGLDNGCHQIDFVGDRLAVIDTYNQCVLLYPPDGGTPDRLVPIACEGTDWNRGYVHLNSLIVRGNDILLMMHNGAEHSGRPSEIAVLDRDWRMSRRETLAGFGCHSFAILEDGTLLACGSQDCELIGSDGLKVKVGGLMTRGLSVDDAQVVVGGSVFSDRDLRDDSGGAVYFLDRDYSVHATLTMPAPVMEIRRIDGRDRSLSNVVSPVGRSMRTGAPLSPRGS